MTSTDPAKKIINESYELGRLRVSLRRALIIVAPVAVIAAVVTGRSALAWLPVTALIWIFVHWRGGALLRGSFFGLVGGGITYALPMSLLRPCCSPELMAAGQDCCTNPSACLAVGALLGLALAVFVPTAKKDARWRTGAGMALGVASVALLRCSTLFAGEAIGLVGGLIAGVLVATFARSELFTRTLRG